MAETVSGNESPLQQESSVDPEVNNYTTYVSDNTDVCRLLDSILNETVKENEYLEELCERFAEVILRTQSETQETMIPDIELEEIDESESHHETVIELLEGIDETLTAISETGESINNTVSGNSIYLEETDNAAGELLEAYTEASTQQSQIGIYGLSLGIGILFITACIVGLLIARAVLGKMR